MTVLRFSHLHPGKYFVMCGSLKTLHPILNTAYVMSVEPILCSVCAWFSQMHIALKIGKLFITQGSISIEGYDLNLKCLWPKIGLWTIVWKHLISGMVTFVVLSVSFSDCGRFGSQALKKFALCINIIWIRPKYCAHSVELYLINLC